MQTVRRSLPVAIAVSAAVLAYVLLSRGVDATVANATWSCGSVVRPRVVDLPLDTRPEDQLADLRVQVACGAERQRQAGRAMQLTLVAGFFSVAVLADRSKRPAPVAQPTSP